MKKMFRIIGTVTMMTAAILFVMIFLSPTATIVQNVSALDPVAQTTSARADGSGFANGAFITLPQGQTSSILNYEVRGFDDNNHIIELRCSFDGVNYLKSNCGTQSAETQSSFAGPDGVVRTYFVKTGLASRQVSPNIIFGTYTFGVKVLNDINVLSPPSMWTVKMRSSAPVVTGGGTGGAQPENHTKKIRVFFESIAVHDDHDGFSYSPMTCCSGEWLVLAFVQGKMIKLLDHNVDGGHSYTLHKDITIETNSQYPLSIFTYGVDNDSFLGMCKVNEPSWEYHAPEIFTFPPTLWKQKIVQFVSEDTCGDNLGIINELYQPPDHGAGLHKVKSSSGDFTLTFVVGPAP